jgi:hypothetical protein
MSRAETDSYLARSTQPLKGALAELCDTLDRKNPPRHTVNRRNQRVSNSRSC